MAYKKNKDTIELTPEEIGVYAASMSGIPIKEIAQKTGKHRNTISAWVNKIRRYVEENGATIEEYRKPLHGLYGMWVNSVIQNLKKCDATFTIAHGKGMNYYQDKQEHEHGFKDQPSDELRLIANEIIGVTDGAEDEAGQDSVGTQTPS